MNYIHHLWWDDVRGEELRKQLSDIEYSNRFYYIPVGTAAMLDELDNIRIKFNLSDGVSRYEALDELISFMDFYANSEYRHDRWNELPRISGISLSCKTDIGVWWCYDGGMFLRSENLEGGYSKPIKEGTYIYNLVEWAIKEAFSVDKRLKDVDKDDQTIYDMQPPDLCTGDEKEKISDGDYKVSIFKAAVKKALLMVEEGVSIKLAGDYISKVIIEESLYPH